MSDEQKERWRELVRGQLAASTADSSDRVKIQATLAADAMKALLLANGGAMIALFTFIGNVLAKSGTIRLSPTLLYWAFGLFVAGFTLALLAHVLAFLSQDRFFHQAMREMERLTTALSHDEPELDQTPEIAANRQGNGFYFAGLALAVASVLLFGLGCWCALSGLLIG